MVFYFLFLCVHDVLLSLPLSDFSHVLHKNAAVVVQTDLSLLHFVFVLNFGIRIFLCCDTVWSPFFLSACHLGYVTHLLHLLMILFLNSCGDFCGILCTLSLGYNYNSSLLAKN